MQCGRREHVCDRVENISRERGYGSSMACGCYGPSCRARTRALCCPRIEARSDRAGDTLRSLNLDAASAAVRPQEEQRTAMMGSDGTMAVVDNVMAVWMMMMMMMMLMMLNMSHGSRSMVLVVTVPEGAGDWY